mgnify:FL=1|jgi:hypothetical protein|tara:strand:+ start:90 stop:290 length:201 start_codon:yes stop_codon:yes gene_type:complete
MANRTFTLTVTDFDMNTAASVAGSDAGSAGAGVVIVDVAESADRSDVVNALHALADLIGGGQEALN